MISRSFCWTIMKGNDQKVGFRDLKCRNGAQNRNLHKKLSKTGPVENFLLWSKSTVNNLVKVNGQRLTCADVAVWHHLRAYVAVHEAEQALGAHEARGRTWGLVREAHGRAWETLTARGAHAREAETSGSAWGHVWCSFWPFLVGFCLGLVVLSLYAFAFTIGWAERWYPRAVGTVGVMAMTRFCQWLLDEGDGSRRTPEMSIGIRKSEE